MTLIIRQSSFCRPQLRPVIDDVLLANSGAGDQFQRIYKIACGIRTRQGGAASAFNKLLRQN